MDVDLSTDLRGLLPLVAPLLSGHSDLAIGTRLAHGARVVRGPKRELISRGYNSLLHAVLRARFSDAQCGFKAARTRRARRAGCSTTVRDDGWFFDTELLVLAQRRGLRIHEVPVDWVDDPDSRVQIVRTALDDLRGVARLAAAAPLARFLGDRRREHARLRAAVPAPARAARRRRGERRRAGDHRGRQHRRQPPADLRAARARGPRAPPRCAARRSSCSRSRSPTARWPCCTGSTPRRRAAVELAVLVLGGALATVTRYVALKTWVFARRPARRRHRPSSPSGSRRDRGGRRHGRAPLLDRQPRGGHRRAAGRQRVGRPRPADGRADAPRQGRRAALDPRGALARRDGRDRPARRRAGVRRLREPERRRRDDPVPRRLPAAVDLARDRLRLVADRARPLLLRAGADRRRPLAAAAPLDRAGLAALDRARDRRGHDASGVPATAGIVDVHARSARRPPSLASRPRAAPHRAVVARRPRSRTATAPRAGRRADHRAPGRRSTWRLGAPSGARHGRLRQSGTPARATPATRPTDGAHDHGVGARRSARRERGVGPARLGARRRPPRAAGSPGGAPRARPPAREKASRSSRRGTSGRISSSASAELIAGR